MKRSTLTKFEKIDQQKAKEEAYFYGEGVYVFQNNTKGEIILEKPPLKNFSSYEEKSKRVAPGGRFEGDNYFMKMVRNNELRLINVIEEPPVKKEVIMKEHNEEKLILDQPETFTSEGQVEHVTKKDTRFKKKINENAQAKKPEVLLTEDPMGGIEVISD